MIHPTLRVDLLIAVAVAALVLIISPGLAISGLIAIVALVVCGIAFLVDARRGRRRRARPVGPMRRPTHRR